MIILPAIDIKDGNCVRLLKGDFSTVEKVAEDPLKTAESFAASGAGYLHMVDLDGAKNARPVNHEIILKTARQSGLFTEVGGGIRDMNSVEWYLSGGVSRVILGSVALKNPAFVREAVKKYGEKIAVGIDSKNGLASTEGWLSTSNVPYLELAKAMEQIGVKVIIFTDISKDGTLSGPNLEQLDAINRSVGCDIVASGGVTDIGDIRALMALNLYGAICGKSIYKGTLDLKQAVITAKGE